MKTTFPVVMVFIPAVSAIVAGYVTVRYASGEGYFDAPLVRMVRALTKNSAPHIQTARIIVNNEPNEWPQYLWDRYLERFDRDDNPPKLTALNAVMEDFWVYGVAGPDNSGVGMAVDWKEDIQEIADQLSDMIGETSGGTIEKAEVEKIYNQPGTVFDEYGPVPVTIASLYHHVGQPQFQLIHIDTGSDYYLYTIVSNKIYRRWVGFVPEGEDRPYLYYGLWQAEGFVKDNLPAISADQLGVVEKHRAPLFAGLDFWDAWRGGFK